MAVAKATAGVGGNPTEQAAAAIAAADAAGARRDEADDAAARAVESSCGLSPGKAAVAVSDARQGKVPGSAVVSLAL